MNRTVEYWQKRIIELKLCPYQDRINELRHKAIDISKNIVIIEARGWITKGGKRIYIEDSKSGGGTQKEPRLDMNGKPFDTPTLYLPVAEYKRVVSEISSNYGNHRGKLFSQVEIDGTTYEFENRRFGDYNIFDKW